MRTFRRGWLALAFGAGLGSILLWQAAAASHIPPRAWSAQWIASANGPARDDGVFYFRRSLVLDKVPAPFRVDVSADTRFELHVNGRRVGSGPALGDLHHWRYETFNLSEYLRTGRNLIAAVVWNRGALAAVSQMSSRTAFLLSAEDPANAAIDTGEGWQVSREMGRSAEPRRAREYFAAGPAEVMDGKQIDWNWDSPEEDQSRWLPARPLGPAAVRGVEDGATPWMLVKDLLPPMTYTPISAGRVVRVSGLPGAAAASLEQPLAIPPHSDVTILLDRRALTTAYPSLEISSGRDASIDLTYAEALYDADRKKGNRNEIAGRHIEGLRDRIVSDGGKRTYRTLWWRTWRYLQVEVRTAATPLTIERLEAFYTAYPFSAAGRFESDDPELARIWDTGWLTAQLCAHETYMDTPYWERLQYIGDTRIQALISYAVAGDDRLARQALEAFHDSLMPDGLTQSRYPSSLTQIIPPFSLLWIGMLHDYWQYRDDPAFAGSLVPGTRGVLEWFAARQRPDGLLGPIEWWPFVDWSPPDFVSGVPPQDAGGGSSALTLQFIEALQYAAALEDRFGEKDRARAYRERERQASEALRRLNWDEEAGLLADTPARNHFSQQANSLAVWLDVIPKDRQQAVMKKVLAAGNRPPMSSASYYFRFYVARAMVHAGLGDLYIPQLEPWRKMLQLGLSTWAETPEPTRSDSHAWSAHPTFDLMTIVAGIAPGAPGFGSVAIAPHLGNLHHVAASMPTPHGPVQVAYKKDGQGWNAQITLPENLSGNLRWHGHLLPLHPGAQTLKLDR
ncbi:MAG: alpha-L-rhamnosidase C-terminal domain-containing protein [Bryobacteraceae bacterium]